MSDQWYCKVVGEEVGPVTENDLHDMFQSGQIAGNDLIRSSDHSAWQRFSRVFPQLATAPTESRTWYFRSFGDDFGPYSFTELKEFVTQEQLTPTDEVRDGQDSDWKPARLVPDLFPDGDDLLAGFDALADAPSEPASPVKPSSESKSHPQKPKRKRTRKTNAESAAAAMLNEAPTAPPAPEYPPPASSPPPEVAPPDDVANAAATAPPSPASTTTTAEDQPPAAPSPPPRPPAPPVSTPPPPRRSSGGGGGGGFALPDWLNGKTIGIAVGLMVLLGGGYLLMGSGLLPNFSAGPVYHETVALYEEFKTASKQGPDSPAFESFYKTFQTKQFEMLSKVGDASPNSSAYQVHRAVQTLGSVVQSFRRGSITPESRQVYVDALESQLEELKPIYGN